MIPCETNPSVLHIDAGLDWIQLGAGEILVRPAMVAHFLTLSQYEKGDKATDFYLVISGYKLCEPPPHS